MQTKNTIDKNMKYTFQLETINETEENEDYTITLNKAREKLQTQFEKCAAKSIKDITGGVKTDVKFEIQLLNPNQRPIYCKMRPLPHNIKDKVQQLLKEQEAAGIIRKSTSEWASALRVVHKPDGDIRLTIDYKPLNKVIKNDNYPLPNISDIYARLAKSKLFSKIDLKAAYHQVPVDEKSIKYTAFICEFGCYEYLVMPMGIKNAPAWFQRFMVETFGDFIENKTLDIYLDDFILHTVNLEQHQEIAQALVNRMEKSNIKCAIGKSQFIVEEVTFLGNIVKENHIYSNKDRAKALMEKPQPSTLKELQAWLGVANYMRKYIKNYAKVVKPLYDLMDIKNVPNKLRKKNGAPDGKKVFIEWNEIAQKHFSRLKKLLCSNLVLSMPNFDNEMIITTDASDKGYGAVLEQDSRMI